MLRITQRSEGYVHLNVDLVKSVRGNGDETVIELIDGDIRITADTLEEVLERIIAAKRAVRGYCACTIRTEPPAADGSAE